METKEIETRLDIRKLVDEFYKKIRVHAVLGPIFNRAIPENSWPAHLEKLTDFWETNLLGRSVFKGNPMAAHRKVDESNNKSIEMEHFGLWIQVWFETIDQLFHGENADRAKRASRKMATSLFFGMKR